MRNTMMLSAALVVAVLAGGFVSQAQAQLRPSTDPFESRRRDQAYRDQLRRQQAQAQQRQAVPTFTIPQPALNNNYYGNRYYDPRYDRRYNDGGYGNYVLIPGHYQNVYGRLVYVPPHYQFVPR